MKRRIGSAAAAVIVALGWITTGGCGAEPEPPVGQSHHTQPGETARFDALRDQADEKSPFTNKVESPHEANARDMQANEGDADFHTEVDSSWDTSLKPAR